MSRIENSPSRPRTALVTGAARRIGRAIAEALHNAGMDVAIHCRRSTSEAQAVSKYLNEERQDSAKVFCGDLVKAGMPAELIDSVINWNGRLDVLVNNASSFYPTPLGQISEADWSDIVGSNLKAPLFLSQAAAGALRSSRGSIVNIVLTRSLAKDLAPEVRVNAVAPGAIAWPENGMPQSVKDHILGEIPLGRSGDPEDIATTVRFLALEATYVTGEIITVDGGRSIGW
jgi:pteridine reductase